MKLIFNNIPVLCMASVMSLGVVFSFNAHAQSAPGAEERCERDCSGLDAGEAQRCYVQVTRCKERADSRGTKYRNCRAKGKSVETCRDEYQ